jgi:septum formation protein
MLNLVLASSSPRRAELLRQLQLEFSVRAAEVDETPLSNECPEPYVRRLAQAKVRAVLPLVAGDTLVLGADTVVSCMGQLLTKPLDPEHNRQMLEHLSGRSHEVFTGISVANGSKCLTEVVRTEVEFVVIDDTALRGYVRSGEGSDKAGGYAVQGIGGIFVKRLVGSYSAVVGLPLAETESLLRSFGMDTWRSRLHEV